LSFSADTKKQLCGTKIGCEHCAASELAGIMDFSASIKGSSISLVTENTDTADRIKYLFDDVFGFDIRYAFNENNHSYAFLIQDENMTENIKFYLQSGSESEKNLFVSPFDCCKGSYIRGAFLGGGSVSDPHKGYHLEFDTKCKASAEYLCRLLAFYDIPVKITIRKSHYIAYTKSSEVIAEILGRMGAFGSTMEFYNISAEKEVRNNLNRIVNCETYNMNKTTKAAVKQISAINKIKNSIGLGSLEEPLRKTAILRMRHPYESLNELAKRLGIGRSGVNHRLARLMEIAEDIK